VIRTTTSLFIFASTFAVAGVSEAYARSCSNASLKGGYGLSVGMLVLPAGTPRAVLGRFSFDGKGRFTNTVTLNDNGMVNHVEDSGTYTVNADCTGKISTNNGTGIVEIVLVDGGREFYSIRTDPSNLVFVFNAAKKQSADESEEERGSKDDR
jgi:hypothetical protein